MCKILLVLLFIFFFAELTSLKNEEHSPSESQLKDARVADQGKRKRKIQNKARSKKIKKYVKKSQIDKITKINRKEKNTKMKRKNKRIRIKKSRKVKSTKKKRKLKSYNSHGRLLEDKCLEVSVTAMRRWKDQVANFLRQKKRIDIQSNTAGKKSGKQGVFGPIALKLIDIGSGNKSGLICSGSAESDGAKQLANLTMNLEKESFQKKS